ncbi:hypothetical protein EFM21_02085 [Leuconostoc falkenbergense]|jgi:hypothetical protein|uniref:hypothetical protein n=1 Tax=Lactobacillales TaxID=186826 RepID=UPI0007DFA1D2|nr:MULTISPECIES: hypothetical protein [Lactobacillales]MCT1224390.1 hypothetical protein [Lactiplantibacillus plantarum]MCT4377962.1 hypothetical protein [Leuconostoc falkenbergense]MDB1685774.1 hypothetical protein [Enterococcus durans]CUW15881.1 FIG00748167: hypothetical protein [Leuconostoc inhae]
MKRYVPITIAFLALALFGSLYGNFYHHAKNDKTLDQVSQLQADNRKIKKKLSTTTRENKVLNSQIEGFKTYQNNKDKSQSELNFNNVANKFLTTMFTFEPDTYTNRKDSIKGLISNDLYNQYFPKNNNYGDANSVSSKLDKATIYTQSKQGDSMKGLAVVSFESKTGNNDWKKETDVYQLTFDTTTNQLTAVQNLGSSFKASDVE